MCSAAAHYDFLDRRLALQAGLALASINAMLNLKKSFFAIGIYVIRNGRSAGSNCGLQHLLYSGMQFV